MPKEMNKDTTDWNEGGNLAMEYLKEREKGITELAYLQGTSRYTAELIYDWHYRRLLADRKRIVGPLVKVKQPMEIFTWPTAVKAIDETLKLAGVSQ